jgi:hypothetical protein
MKSLRSVPGLLMICFVVCFGIVWIAPGLVRAQDQDSSVTVSTTYADVDGDWRKFQEDLQMKDDFTGGIEEFNISRELGDGSSLDMRGNFLYENDFDISVDLGRNDFGYVNFGYKEFRHYYDTSGWYYTTSAGPAAGSGSYYGLNSIIYEITDRDVYSDRGNFFIDVGLTLPDYPKFTLGYERLVKDGKLLTLWGSKVGSADTRDGNSARTRPVIKEIKGTTDIFKLGSEFKMGKVSVALNQRWEDYEDDTYVDEQRYSSAGAREQIRVWDGEPSYESSTTTLNVDSQVNEKVYLAFGYMYDKVENDSLFTQEYLTGTGAASYNKDEINNPSHDSDYDSHVVTLGSTIKPNQHWLITAGLRGEFADTSGTSRSYEDTGDYKDDIADMDETTWAERVGLRYSAIPRTILSFDAEWEQSDVDYYERHLDTNRTSRNYTRDTDADLDTDTYTFGASTRPIRELYLSARYRRINGKRDYTDNVLTGFAATGYPGYIGDRDIKTDEFMVNALVRPSSLLSFNLRYQLEDTDYDIKKEIDSEVASTENQIISGSITLAPIEDLFITGLYAIQDMQAKSLASGSGGNDTIANYDGDVDSFMLMVNYLLNEKITLSADYQISSTEGSVYDPQYGSYDGAKLQSLLLGVDYKVKEDVSLSLKYGYYDYNEDGNGGIDGYTANVIYAGAKARF